MILSSFHISNNKNIDMLQQILILLKYLGFSYSDRQGAGGFGLKSWSGEAEQAENLSEPFSDKENLLNHNKQDSYENFQTLLMTSPGHNCSFARISKK